MAKETKISWADHTGNPWIGCTAAHTGCLNCYARDFSQKKHGVHGAEASRPWALWGPGRDRYVTKGFWTDAPKWAHQAARESTWRTVFPSMMDPLDAEVYERASAPDGVACRATFDRFMDLIHATGEVAVDAVTGKLVTGCCETQVVGGITWLLLTKRPENWRWIPEHVRPYCWLIYSASDQPSLDAGIGELLAAEGFAGLGLSLEPLVGPIDLASPYTGDLFDRLLAQDEALGHTGARTIEDALPGLRWVIIGGESGLKVRPCNVEWIRSLVRQCREAGTVPYVKQLGARIHWGDLGGYSGSNMQSRAFGGITHPAGADPAEWPEDLRVQEWPEGLR